MQELSIGIANLVRLSFEDGIDPYGNKWAELSPVTIEKRRQQSDVPGRDTGRLMNSLLEFNTDSSAGVETNTLYARAFNFGASQGDYGRASRGNPIPWGNVPGRAFIPDTELPRSWDDEIEQLTGDYMQGAWDG